MADDVSKPEESAVPFIGLILLGLLIYGGYKLVQYVTSRGQAPPPIVALTAYFVNEDGNPVLDDKAPDARLKIRGQVHQRPDDKSAKPTDGKVRLTVSTLDQAFSQTLIIEAKNGDFETEDVSLRKLRPSDQIHIKAEFLSASAADEPPGDIYLNTRPPKITSDTLWAISAIALVIVFIVFFYSFTGKKTPLKNRIAVIFSYCVIGIFLFLPLMAPVLLVPSDRRGMTDRPVALVLTRVGLEPDAKVQWALNIGGYATAPTPASPPSPSPVPSPSPLPTLAATRRPSPGATATAQPTVSPTARPVAASESPAISPSPGQSPVRTPPASTRSTAGTPTPTPQVVEDLGEDLVVKVEGGLVIPLYVIILSVIGGAINMTRKVPQLQEEGERSEIVVGGLRPTLRATWNRIRHPLGNKPAAAPTPSAEALAAQQSSEAPKQTDAQTSAADSPPATPAETKPITVSEPADDAIAGDIDSKVGQLLESYAKSDTDAQNAKGSLRDLLDKMKDLFDKRQDKKPILNYDSFDDWLKSHPALKELFTSHWRVELLSQYMYLVSAPFLAIVAYYMLELAGVTKQPILVVISFSVGLVSERILSWLLGIASGYLQQSATQTAKNQS